MSDITKILRKSAVEALREKLITAEKYSGEDKMIERLSDANWDVDKAFNFYNSNPRAKPPLLPLIKIQGNHANGLTPRTSASIESLVTPRAYKDQARRLLEIEKINTGLHHLSFNTSLSGAEMTGLEPLFLKKAPITAHKPAGITLPPLSLQVNPSLTAEFGLTPRTTAAQIAGLQQFEKRGPKFVDIVEDEAYLSLVAKCMADPFMIMGYQNGRPNLHYESTWKIINNKKIFIGRIYIPREEDLNDRKYTRYPNQLMSNTDGKTIVNLSLHNWALGMHYWHDKINNNYPTMNRKIIIQMPYLDGISEVESSVEGADFFSISKTPKSIPYLVHDSSYSPDTGVLALDDNKHTCICHIIIENGPTLKLIFYRNKVDYNLNTSGGTRKRHRQTKRRQTKRRQTKRRQRL